MSAPEGAFTNRLAGESSPYLRLHARNPVDWYPWGEEAFARARSEDKPIFLSVGYSTCYWCHVMERECFSDPEIARQMNEGFVCVKLDREERPDLDEIYMSATQLMTRAGGWPNSVFLTPDRKPFFAGTYFPPRDAMGRPGFPRVLAALREAWALRRGELLTQAESVTEAMRQQLGSSPASASAPDPNLPERVLSGLEERFDLRYGGFGRAPKFPSPANLAFLLELARAQGEQAREMLVVTLDNMARGGLFDQLAGGFHRYSTDEAWLVPHFEKMLYDNAALCPLYAEAAELAPELGFREIAAQTAAFVRAELTSPEGTFLSAIDAETGGHEGLYYTWTQAEVDAALAGADVDQALLREVLGLTGPPNFEDDRYVLHLAEPLSSTARARGLTEAELRNRLRPGLAALRTARDARPRPLVDDKVLTDWNGLMIAGLARAGAALGDPTLVRAAAAAAEGLLERAVLGDKTLAHAYRQGEARIAALLDDYAFLIQGLIALAHATGDEGWIREAARLQEEQDRRLLDAVHGGYFAGDGADLLFRAKPAFDGAVASGNGTSARNLLALAELTGNADYAARAAAVTAAFAESMTVVPLGHVTLAHAIFRSTRGPRAPSAVERGAALPAVPVAGVSSGVLEDLEDLARDVVAVQAGVEPGFDSWRPFTLDLVVRDGWHIGAHGTPSPELVSTSLHAVLGKVRDVRYPEGGSAGGKAPPIYTGRVRIVGEIEAPPAGAPSLELTYQACDEARCLPPVTRLVRFP